MSLVSLNRNSGQPLLRLAERDGTAVMFNECNEPFGRQDLSFTTTGVNFPFRRRFFFACFLFQIP